MALPRWGNSPVDLNRCGIWLVVVVAVLGTILQASYGYSVPFSGNAFGSDDAFISYRYAANLLDGHGLVFNPDERVEGYSNLLYTLLMVPGLLLAGHEHLYLFSLTINTALLAGACVVFQRVLLGYLDGAWPLLGAGLMALSPVLWANAATGLESTLMLLLVLAVWLVLQKPQPSLRWLLALALMAMLCRVDGFTLPMLAAVVLLLVGQRKAAFAMVAFVVIVLALHTLWRLFYYDDYIANTVHAKVTGQLVARVRTGLDLLWYSGRFNGTLFFAISTALLAATRQDLVLRSPFPFIFLAASLGYYVYLGGDIYYERFLLPVIPIGIFSSLLLASRLQRRSRRLVLPLVALAAGLLVFKFDERFAYRSKTYDMWETLGRFLQRVDPRYTIAVDAAGKIPYYSGLPALDVLGLNDRHIGQREMPPTPLFYVAHAKFDPDYVLSRQPELIASWVAPGLGLAWGMSRELFSGQYQYKYLVHGGLDGNTQNILDVQGASDEQLLALVAKGYTYAVLGRKDVLARLPKSDRPVVNTRPDALELPGIPGR